MSLETIAQTDKYALRTCKLSNRNLLVRTDDNGICYLTDSDVGVMTECIADSEEQFDVMASTYTFIDPVMEKKC